jgi:hypothetical protein
MDAMAAAARAAQQFGVPPSPDMLRAFNALQDRLRRHIQGEGVIAEVLLAEVFGRTDQEAERMAPHFGKHLKAACEGRHHTPPTVSISFGGCPHDVALYHPRADSDLIHGAFEKFKATPGYVNNVDREWEHQRLSTLRYLEDRNIGGSRTNPRQLEL